VEGVGTLGQLLRVMRGNAKWEDLLVDHANHTTLEWERIADESLDTEYPDAELPHKRTTEEEAENDEYRLDRYVPPTYQYEFPKQTQHSEQQHDPDPWDRELVPGQEDDSLWEILNTINLDHKRLVVYDKAGAGKSVFSLRVKTFLTSDEARTRFFQKRAPLVVRWHGGWKGQGTTVAEAVRMGFSGDPCPDCGQFMLVPNGNCFKCTGCGATTGCS